MKLMDVARHLANLKEEAANLQKFADKVKEMGKMVKSGRKDAFIIDVFNKGFQRIMTLERFKELLLAAMRQGLLTLGRSDLAHLHPPEKIQGSEIKANNATFHVIQVEP